MKITEFIKNKIVFLDGAMGTMLQKSGLPIGERPELLNITHPQKITEIHKEYIEKGAQIIYSNTFGANAHKLSQTGKTVDEIITAAIKNAKAATNENQYVALDIGPIGELLEPAGSLKFEEAYDLFKEMMVAGEKAGADLIVIETMTDLYEVKAAVLAAKENTSLPIFVTMTFEENHRTFTGCSVLSMAMVLEGLGVDAIGFNCSLGPYELYPIMEELSHYTSLPLIIKANAGLPDPDTNLYNIDDESFSTAMARFLDLGVTIFGGCCGTTPSYIEKMREKIVGKTPKQRDYKPFSALCTPTNPLIIDKVCPIGERINPTGKKRFKQALIENDFDYILSQGVEQANAGAKILDVNVGLPEINEPEMMKKTVKNLQSVLELPLQLDSSDVNALETGLRIYNGKAVVNSVNGEDKSLHSILPLIKKYGASVVGLTLDEKGIPQKAEERFKIAEKILNTALSYGIKKQDVFIDCLTLTASVQQKEVVETLKAVRMVTEKLKVKTVLGVSNISFGLPNRELINRSFLLLALEAGLTLPIINPNISSMMDTISAFNVLFNHDKSCTEFVEKYSSLKAKETKITETSTNENPEALLFKAVTDGMKNDAKAFTDVLLKDKEPMTIVDNILIPALDEVGKKFEKGTLFLPQLLRSAAASQEAFSSIKDAIAKSGNSSESKGKIILATVKGDIHDIGKNIVKTLLENYGFRVIDLGKNVEPELILETAKKENVKLIGLSALMTTTLKNMELTIKLLKENITDCKIMVGGAVLTPDYSLKIGADYYAKDARQAVEIAKKFYNK